MITGECPHCKGVIINAMPDRTPAYSRQVCESCKKSYWLCHSRVESWAMKEEDFLEEYDVDEKTMTIVQKVKIDEQEIKIPPTVAELFKFVHENRHRISAACGVPSEFLELRWPDHKLDKMRPTPLPEKLMEQARKLWQQIAPDKPADGVEVAIIASAWRELWQDSTNLLNHCLNDHYDKSEYQELESQVEELKKDVAELTAGRRGDTQGYNLAYERRKEIEKLKDQLIGVRYHGCLSGDCPHGEANQCLKALMKDVEDICKE